MARHPYYNYDKIMSYNAIFNFLVGARGLGKTYGKKVKAFTAFFKRGDQFIYVRRYKSELTAARNTFFADVAHLFHEYDFRVMGPEAQCSPVSAREDKKRQWETMGYFVALSTAQTQKSVSYPRVKTIIFDEFIIEKGSLNYLPDEATIFQNFYSTVDRGLDKTKVFFLANSVSIMNPYFIAYEIRPDMVRDEFIVSHGGFIVCHFPEAAAFASSIFETRFGKFIKDTEYGEYAIGNQFSDNHEALIGLKDSNAKYMFSLECKTGTFSIWRNSDTREWFVQTKRPKVEILFTLLADRMTEDKVLVTFNDKGLSYLRTAFRQGKVTFDKQNTRNVFAEIFKR